MEPGDEQLAQLAAKMAGTPLLEEEQVTMASLLSNLLRCLQKRLSVTLHSYFAPLGIFFVAIRLFNCFKRTVSQDYTIYFCIAS
jgi:hypothetical protein